MSSTYCTLYVLRLLPPAHFYVGTTLRPFGKRLGEHKKGHGSKWSTRHGFHSVVEHYEVPVREASRLEDEKTIELMRAHGWQGIRGGNFTYAQDDDETWWLPDEFRPDHVNGYGLYH